MYHAEHTAELLNNAAKERGVDVYIKWDGDDEYTSFCVFYEEEETPYTIDDRGTYFEINYCKPGTRTYLSEWYGAGTGDVVEALVGILREKDV